MYGADFYDVAYGPNGCCNHSAPDYSRETSAGEVPIGDFGGREYEARAGVGTRESSQFSDRDHSAEERASNAFHNTMGSGETPGVTRASRGGSSFRASMRQPSPSRPSRGDYHHSAEERASNETRTSYEASGLFGRAASGIPGLRAATDMGANLFGFGRPTVNAVDDENAAESAQADKEEGDTSGGGNDTAAADNSGGWFSDLWDKLNDPDSNLGDLINAASDERDNRYPGN